MLADPKERTTAKNMWEQFIVNTLCGICGNHGKFTTLNYSPAGVLVGGTFFCICPNGRALRRSCRIGNETSKL